MRKLILTSATLGIIAVGGIANANADTVYRGTMYRGYDQPMYEGRNVYVDEPAYVVQPRPMYRTLGPNYGYQPSYADPWYMPGDAAIINQERANQRSTR